MVILMQYAVLPNQLALSSVRLLQSEIRDEIYGASDHCPVVMELEGQL